MKWIKYIAWDIHQPQFRLFTAVSFGLAALGWTLIGALGWIQIFKSL